MQGDLLSRSSLRWEMGLRKSGAQATMVVDRIVEATSSRDVILMFSSRRFLVVARSCCGTASTMTILLLPTMHVLFFTCLPLTLALTPFGSTNRNIATQVLQGAGAPTVDLNQYNVPDAEWTAQLVQKTNEVQGGIFLATPNPEHFVDRVMVQVPRVSPTLGLQLAELAGGRGDGVGITVVSGISNDSPFAQEDVVVGDSISKVSLLRRKRTVGGSLLQDQEEILEYPLECKDYDATLSILQSLPPPQADEFLQLELKRIRRKPKVTVKLQYPPSQEEEDTTLTLFAGENLRLGMLLRGVKLNDPLAQRFDTKSGGNCGAGGLCRTCAVSVLRGQDLLNPQRPAEQQMLRDEPRWRLACKAIVGFGMQEGEMTIRVNPRQW